METIKSITAVVIVLVFAVAVLVALWHTSPLLVVAVPVTAVAGAWAIVRLVDVLGRRG